MEGNEARLQPTNDFDKTLLITKLHVPPPCQILVPRPRLALALSKSLTSSLTLVSAPAGYGKTTLVSSWLRENNVSATWLSLDEGDNDPIRFSNIYSKLGASSRTQAVARGKELHLFQ